MINIKVIIDGKKEHTVKIERKTIGQVVKEIDKFIWSSFKKELHGGQNKQVDLTNN